MKYQKILGLVATAGLLLAGCAIQIPTTVIHGSATRMPFTFRLLWAASLPEAIRLHLMKPDRRVLIKVM